MTPYNPNIHHRRSIRLKGYDYAKEGLYFITLCVQNREQIFGEIKNPPDGEAGGEMILNPYGRIAYEEFAPTPSSSASSRIIEELNFKIRQRNYYENIIRSKKAYLNISKYIINNPKKWTENKIHSNERNDIGRPMPFLR